MTNIGTAKTPMKKLVKIVSIAFSAVLLVIVALIVLVAIRQGIGWPIRYEFASAYQGWVVIQYDNPTCSPFESDGIYLVIPIQPSGRACTSSPVPKGWRYNQYEYVAPDGERIRIPFGGEDNRIWADSVAYAQATVRFPKQTFFVGTKKELESSWSERPLSHREE